MAGFNPLVISKQISGGDKLFFIYILLKKRTAGHVYSGTSSILYIQQ